MYSGVIMHLAFSESHIGDRDENLDRFGHYVGLDWFVSFVIDGFKPSSPHYVDSLFFHLDEKLSALTKSQKITIDTLEYTINESFNEASEQGKASLVIVIGSGETVNTYTAGDTRAYFLTENVRTIDHSVAQKMISEGRSPEHSLRVHPYRRYLTKNVDKLSNIYTLERQERTKSDGLILCSDGFWSSALSDNEIYNVSSNTLANELFNTIKDRKLGSRDNITMMLIVG